MGASKYVKYLERLGPMVVHVHRVRHTILSFLTPLKHHETNTKYKLTTTKKTAGLSSRQGFFSFFFLLHLEWVSDEVLPGAQGRVFSLWGQTVLMDDVRKRMYTCLTGSLCCTADTGTAL